MTFDINRNDTPTSSWHVLEQSCQSFYELPVHEKFSNVGESLLIILAASVPVIIDLLCLMYALVSEDQSFKEFYFLSIILGWTKPLDMKGVSIEEYNSPLKLVAISGLMVGLGVMVIELIAFYGQFSQSLLSLPQHLHIFSEVLVSIFILGAMLLAIGEALKYLEHSTSNQTDRLNFN